MLSYLLYRYVVRVAPLAKKKTDDTGTHTQYVFNAYTTLTTGGWTLDSKLKRQPPDEPILKLQTPNPGPNTTTGLS